MLRGWYGVHTSGVQFSNYCCDVNYDNLKRCDVHCSYLVASNMDVIARSNDVRKKQWSQHKLDSASEHIAFADPECGIFGASPVETMHALRKGVIEKSTI